jgi:cobalamin biosynthesis protein CobT
MFAPLKKSLIVLSIIPYLISYISYAQEKPVRLVEKKQKKRTILYVQNDTNTDKSVFLKINPIGYRKSAQRPIIKNIPAKSKIQMLILIPLTDVESHYTYNLIVNEELETIDVKRNKS